MVRNAGAGAGAPAGLVSLTGCTPNGMPLAYSRAPAKDLAPWVHSLAVADIIMPQDLSKCCAFFSENAAIRVLLKGHWKFETADGVRSYDATKGSRILFFGPQTRIMPVEVNGPIRFLQLRFHPGIKSKDKATAQRATMDRIVAFDAVIPAERRGSFFRDEDSRMQWLDVFENVTRNVLFPLVDEAPSELVLDFEHCLLTDQAFDLGLFATRHGISRRTLERNIGAAFGLSPTAVLRRARALDMAAALLGVAMPEEEAQFRLRYFDQAHMTRQIKTYFGKSPGALAKCEAPLLRIDLEIRQMRRVEAMQALGIDDVPWRGSAVAPGNPPRLGR